MPQYLNFVAVSGEHAFFGLAADPAARVAQMREASPFPIKIAGRWLCPPASRADVVREAKESLKRVKRDGEWFRVSADRAVRAMHDAAIAHGGAVWRHRTPPDLRDAHPGARHVVTPDGTVYRSAALAGEAHGISRQAAWERANRRVDGWRWEDDATPRPVPRRSGRPPTAVRTPLGKFASYGAAAEAHAININTVSARVQRGVPGWRAL